MRFWVSKQSEAPIKEQLVTQILLAISSRELEAGTKLPSTRALARQLGIHANTVSAAYRELHSRGWVRLRKGSGVYVAPMVEQPPLSGEHELDRLVNELMRSAREGGFSLGQVRARLERWMELQPPDHFLVIEDDEELRRILLQEIEAATDFPARGVSQQDCLGKGLFVGAQPVALYGRGAELPRLLPGEVSCLWLQVRSVQAELEKSQRALPDGWSLTVASRWPEFLERGRTMLLAAGFDPKAIHLLDARKRGWSKGLSHGDFVITDSVTERSLPEELRAGGATFHMLSEEALETLRSFVERLR